MSEEYEVLPNLARFVGATIRDKVVLAQMGEIAVLKAQLEATRRVEITGPGGTPVIATGQFDAGQFETNANDEDGYCGVLWSVGLQTHSDRNTRDPAVPLILLSHLEIRIGGIMYLTSEDIEGTKLALGIRQGNKFDLERPDGTRRKGAMRRSAVCEFASEQKTAFLTFHLKDFPGSSWRSLRSMNMQNRSIAIRNELRDMGLDHDEEEDIHLQPVNMYDYVTRRLAETHPYQRAEITSVSFSVGSVREAIGSIRRGKEFDFQKEKYLSDQY